MRGLTPERTEPGPSKESTRAVASESIAYTGVAAGLFFARTQLPTGGALSGILGLLSLFVFIAGLAWVMELLSRALLWANTREYNG